jgi:hypothetical protein
MESDQAQTEGPNFNRCFEKVVFRSGKVIVVKQPKNLIGVKPCWM